MTDLVERVARAIAATQDEDWDDLNLFMVDANDTLEGCREAYRDMARAAIRISLKEAARLFDPPDECDCSVCQDKREQAAAIRALIKEEKNG